MKSYFQGKSKRPMLLLNKCGNAGQIAEWILGEIGDSLDYWQYGNGVVSAKSNIKLAIGDTVITLENKWWGVRGSLSSGHSTDSLLATWNLKYLWAPTWLRESFSISWGATAALNHLRLHNPFYWSEDQASQRLRAAMPHKVY